MADRAGHRSGSHRSNEDFAIGMGAGVRRSGLHEGRAGGRRGRGHLEDSGGERRPRRRHGGSGSLASPAAPAHVMRQANGGRSMRLTSSRHACSFPGHQVASSISIRHACASRFLIFSILTAGCRGAEQSGVRVHGPLAPLVLRRPAALAACDSVAHAYVTPFWHGPYRECRDSVGDRLQFLELDADTLVTEVATRWTVQPKRRRIEFAAAEEEITRLYGRGFHCARTGIVWHGADSVRVALILQNESDVVGPTTLETTPWKIRLVARLGPLPDGLWCRGPGTPPP